MLARRLIPCLLMSNGALLKTVKFKDATYVGDPVNIIRIFNQKEVDELMLLDIHATSKGTGIDYATLEKVLSECFMPVCYGGGVRSIDEMRRLYTMGIEKISLGAAAFEVPDLVRRASDEFGSQAVVVTLDVKGASFFGSPTVRVRNAQQDTKMKPADAARRFEREGAGEILLYSIDRDGTWSGMDVDLIKEVAQAVSIPLIATGGAGSTDHIRDAARRGGASAVAIGSMAVFQGKDLGVLVKFPSRRDQEQLLQ
jgi:imidazole glycerol-phosphate synthase subunit HisF